MQLAVAKSVQWLFLLGSACACSSNSSDAVSTGNTSTGGRISAPTTAVGGGGGFATGSASAAGGTASGGAAVASGGAAVASGGISSTAATGGTQATGGTRASGGTSSTAATDGTRASGGTSSTAATGGTRASGGTSSTAATGGTRASGGTSSNYPFPQNTRSAYCSYPHDAAVADVVAAYADWKAAVVTPDGASGFLRVKKPDSGSVIGSTVSEGIGYGMLLAVYMGDQETFDNLWLYEQSHLDSNGLMNWEVGPDNKTTSGGSGAATDGDEDMAFALVMADRQWGTSIKLTDTYLNYAKSLIDRIWKYEVDQVRGFMLKPGDQWGDVDVTNPSYFAPAYYRVFGEVTGNTQNWNKVVDSSYSIIAKSLNSASGNQGNGLVPAWCNSSGTPVEAYSGAPLFFQNDSTRTPFRLGQDYCYFGEDRARVYLTKISTFYTAVGVTKITNGYNLDGTPHPEKDYGNLQAASFVGPAAVAAMSSPLNQQFINDAYAEVATLKLSAGTIYYQKSWTALSLLMLTGNFVVFGL